MSSRGSIESFVLGCIAFIGCKGVITADFGKGLLGTCLNFQILRGVMDDRTAGLFANGLLKECIVTPGLAGSQGDECFRTGGDG